MSSEMPNDPLSLMAQGAVAVHEMFTGLMGAGFTEQQALYLVGVWLANMRPPE